MPLTKNNSNPKSLSAGSILHASGGKTSQDPIRKTGQPTPHTTAKPTSASIPAPALKTIEPAKLPKASNRPKPFVVSKAITVSKVLNAAPPPTALKPIPACKPLRDLKASKVTKAPSRLKTLAASKVLDIARADAPKAPPGLKASDALETFSPRATAADAVFRQVSEQKQKAAAVTARKAKTKSEPIPPAKPGITRDARSPSASASRPKVKVTATTAHAAENVPPPGTRTFPALRKGSVRKPVFVVSRSYSTPSPPSSLPHTDGGGCNHHNSLSASARLSECTGLTRRNAIRKLDPVIKPRASRHAPAVLRTSSAPLLGYAKAPAAVMRSTSGPVLAGEVVKAVAPQPENRKVQSKILQVMNVETPPGDEGAVDANLIAKISKADTDSSSSSTFVSSNDGSTNAHLPLDLSPPFQISIQDFDVQSTGRMFLPPASFSSILDLFPAAPTHIPGPLTQNMHRELASVSPAFTAAKTAIDSARARDSLPSPFSTSRISSLLDQFSTVPKNVMLADEGIVRTVIVSLDGEAYVLDSPPAWKVAFDGESSSGSATAVGSSVSSQEKTPVASRAASGVRKWWGHVVGRK